MAKYFPTFQSSLDTFLQWRAAQQRLLRPSEPDIVRLLPAIGWLSASPGNAELALFPREQGKPLPDWKKALAEKHIVRVRAMRGAYTYVERSMAAHAVVAGQTALSRRWRPAWNTAGVEEKQRTAWKERILTILGNKEMTLEALREAAPEETRKELTAGVVKKAGGSKDFFAWLIVELEEAGALHVDEQSLVARFEVRFPHLMPPARLDKTEAINKVVERFFLWGNAANPEDLGWWMGTTAKQAEAIMFSGDLPLSNVVLNGGNARGLMMHSSLTEGLRTFKTVREGPVYFLGARDPMYAHTPAFFKRIAEEKFIPVLFSADSVRPLVLENGRPVAAWRWSENGVEWTPATRMTPPLRKKIEAVGDRLAAWIKDNIPELSQRYGA